MKKHLYIYLVSALEHTIDFDCERGVVLVAHNKEDALDLAKENCRGYNKYSAYQTVDQVKKIGKAYRGIMRGIILKDILNG